MLDVKWQGQAQVCATWIYLAFAIVKYIPKLGRKGILTIKQCKRLRICAGVVCIVGWYDQAPGMKQTTLAFLIY